MKLFLKILGITIASIIGALVICIVVILLLDVHRKYSPKTPAKILKSQLGIDLKDFDYTVKSFKEKWALNGDGECEIIFEFKELTPKNIEYLKSVNVKPLPMPDYIRKRFIVPKYGYFLYDTLPGDHPDYTVFIIDTDNNTAVLRYEIF